MVQLYMKAVEVEVRNGEVSDQDGNFSYSTSLYIRFILIHVKRQLTLRTIPCDYLRQREPPLD